MIAVIDYGIGNLKSVVKALQALGFDARVTHNINEIKNSEGVILPGVGAFDSGITNLRKTRLESVILSEIAKGKPFLGICLGMQLLFSASEEGKLNGLGIFPGTSKKFPKTGLTVPQMGWNRLIVKNNSRILNGIETGTMVYFANSYYVLPKKNDIVSAETDYGISFASVITKNNVFGVQFHPEKSGEKGLEILKNFGNVCKGEQNV